MSQTPIVALGASAGGLKEFEQFFKNMPNTKELAFVIIQHLSPNHKSGLVAIVKRYTEMPVCQIEHNMKVKAGTVYIIPPKNTVLLKKDQLVLRPIKSGKINMPIDDFFSSLKAVLGEKAIAVILSGTGSDGASGIREIKEVGGLTIVQQPDTADYDGMPNSAIGTGLVDYIIPVSEMPQVILNHLENEFKKHLIIKNNKASENHISEIFDIIAKHTGHDFSHYKKNTIHRRIERRLTVNKLKSLESYLTFLQKNAKEVGILYKELLISVTSFFRDKETFEYIRKNLVPALMSNSKDETLRLWVPACATGQEAYSWAILLQNYADDNKLTVDIQVFASDIDFDAITIAREGFYTNNIEIDVPTDLLKRNFLKEKNGYRVKKNIRKIVVFAEQNLLQDPPYSKLDLISCRNLLIYFDTFLQQKAISIFHYALRPSGYLLLGNSESLGSSAQFYEAVERKFKLFRKNNDITMSAKVWRMSHDNPYFRKQEKRTLSKPVSEIAKQFLLETQTPPSVVIDSEGTMLYAQGKTGKFLEITTGDISDNILKIVKTGLRVPLSNTLRKAKKMMAETSHRNIKMNNEKQIEFVDIIISPLKTKEMETTLFVVVFKEGMSSVSTNSRNEEKNNEDSVIYELEKELAEKEQYLQSTIEELETTNEELKSSNEEAQSTNEELQSTNEELETSKEELQSVNEELSTTNNELELKIEELNSANSQLGNLLVATHIATVFLDRNLRIFNFTPAICNIIDLLPTDIGRSIKQFTNSLKYDGLVDDAMKVLKSLVPIETEVENFEDKSFWMRILPYRTNEDKIEGVVISFTDISEKKEQDNALKEAEKKILDDAKFYADVFASVDNAIVVLDVLEDGQFKFKSANLHYEKLVGVRNAVLKGKTLDYLSDRIDANTYEFFVTLNEECVEKKEIVVAEQQIIKGHSNNWWQYRMVPILNPKSKQVVRIVGSAMKINRLKQTQFELEKYQQYLEERVEEKIGKIKENEAKLKRSERITHVGSWEWNLENDTITWSDEMFRIFGLEREDGVPDHFLGEKSFYTKDALKIIEGEIKKAIEEGEPYEVELGFKRGDKPNGVLKAFGFAQKNEDGTIEKLFGSVQDITKIKQAENKFRTIFEQGLSAIMVADDAGNYVSVNKSAADLFGYSIEELKQMNVADLISVNSRPSEEQYKDFLEKGAMDGEFEFLDKHGQQKTAVYRALRIQKDFNLSLLFDITATKKYANELKKKAALQEKLNKDKDDFISVLAHDLKNPLNGMIGFAKLLLKNVDTYDKKEIKEQAQIIADSAEHLGKVLKDTLFWANSDTYHLGSKYSLVAIADVLKEEILQIKSLADQKDIELVNKAKLDKKIYVKEDVLRIVFRNVINNALKFTPAKGQITVKTHNGNNSLTVTVTDTGVGMTKAAVASIFKIEQMRNTKGTNNEKGSGLGLKICERLLKSVGGQIEINSAIGKGTTVTFTLPEALPSEEPKKEPKKKTNRISKPTLLIVDDEPINFELLKVLIQKEIALDCEIIYATDGQNAIDLFTENTIHLILMDISMPVMDGLEASKCIKEIDKNVPIIIQSGNIEKDIAQKVKEVGCEAFLPKPIESKKLKSLLERHLM